MGKTGQKSLASFFAKKASTLQPGPTQQQQIDVDAAPTQAVGALQRHSQTLQASQVAAGQQSTGQDEHAELACVPALPAKRPRSEDVSTAGKNAASMSAPGSVSAVHDSAQAAPASAPGPRNPMRQALAKRKLGMTRRRLILGPDASDTAAHAHASSKSKLTPLEQQVVDLKKQNPGNVLIVEVSAILLQRLRLHGRGIWQCHFCAQAVAILLAVLVCIIPIAGLQPHTSSLSRARQVHSTQSAAHRSTC